MTDNRFYVYVYRYPDGTPYYVGKGSGRRDRTHLCDAKAGRNQSKWAVRVTGKLLANGEVPVIERVSEGLTNDEACALEMILIAEYGRRDIGTGILTNCTDGGDRGARGLSPEAKARQIEKFLYWTRNERVVDEGYRERISQGLKDYYAANPMSDERRAWLRERFSGERNPFYGKKHFEGSRRQMSESHKQYVFTDEHRARISEALHGTRVGEDNPFFGRSHSAKSREKIGAGARMVVDRLREQGLAHWNKGLKRTDEQRAKLRIERTCPHCGRVGRGSAMNRYHMDNCKKAPSGSEWTVV